MQVVVSARLNERSSNHRREFPRWNESESDSFIGRHTVLHPQGEFPASTGLPIARLEESLLLRCEFIVTILLQKSHIWGPSDDWLWKRLKASSQQLGRIVQAMRLFVIKREQQVG